MLSGILEIGRILGANDIDEYLSKRVNLKSFGEDAKIIRVVFDTNERVIKFDPEELDNSKLLKYLWVGNSKGSSAQMRLTTDNLYNLFFDSIGNIYNALADDMFSGSENKDLKEYLHQILEIFGVSVAQKKGKEKKIINIAMLDGASEDLKSAWSEYIQSPKPENEEKLKESLEEHLKEKGLLKKKAQRNTLFTAFFGDVPLATLPGYKKLLYDEFILDAFTDVEEGHCHGCGRKSKVTTNFKQFELKFFIVDKKSFASEFTDEGFYRNYALCPSCYTSFSVAEKFLNNHLNTKFANVQYVCLIVPDFFETPDVSAKFLEERAKRILQATDSLNSFEKWNDYRRELEDKLESESFALNYVFVEKSNAAVKVKKLITDVSPSRIKRVLELREDTYENFKKILGKKEDERILTRLDFRKIFFLFPVRKDTPNNILEVYDSILTNKHLSRSKLISDFVEVLTVFYYDKFEAYYHRKPEKESGVDFMVLDHMLNSNQFLCYLTELGILKEGGVKAMNYEELSVLGEDLKDYISQLQLGGAETALFLLGTLVAYVAKEQVKKGDGKKAILDKINYYGMPLNKVVGFSNEVYDKLRQYKVLDASTELIYATCKRYMDGAISNWKLTPQENVYWIKSGYAFQTKKFITKGRETGENNE